MPISILFILDLLIICINVDIIRNVINFKRIDKLWNVYEIVLIGWVCLEEESNVWEFERSYIESIKREYTWMSIWSG